MGDVDRRSHNGRGSSRDDNRLAVAPERCIAVRPMDPICRHDLMPGEVGLKEKSVFDEEFNFSLDFNVVIVLPV